MIYDVFNFFNELELLEVRLHELDDFADRFVLVESTTTFQGNPKELVYEKNKGMFERWHNRIIHVVIDDSPPLIGESNWDTMSGTWAIEIFQFNAATRGLKELKPNDVVMWSCADEIPKKSSVEKTQKSHPIMMMQYPCSGYLNCSYTGLGFWTGSRLLTGDQWMRSSNQYVDFRRVWLDQQLADGGWHFCNIGGVERWKLKLQSFAHKEYNCDPILLTIKDKLEYCYNLYDPGTKTNYDLLPWEKLPRYIVENKEKFSHLLIPNP